MNRRNFLKGTLVGATALGFSQPVFSASSELDDVRAEIARRHEEALKRLQNWIHQQSIAAENRGVSEGCDYTIELLR